MIITRRAESSLQLIKVYSPDSRADLLKTVSPNWKPQKLGGEKVIEFSSNSSRVLWAKINMKTSIETTGERSWRPGEQVAIEMGRRFAASLFWKQLVCCSQESCAESALSLHESCEQSRWCRRLKAANSRSGKCESDWKRNRKMEKEMNTKQFPFSCFPLNS